MINNKSAKLAVIATCHCSKKDAPSVPGKGKPVWLLRNLKIIL